MTTPAFPLDVTTEGVPAHPDLPAPAPGMPAPVTLSAVRDGLAVARAAVWPEGPTWQGRTTGLVGRYAALDAEAAASVLGAATDRVRRAGRDLVVGPLDGSTWFSYRLVTERGTEPPFALEPWHPPAHLDQWQAAGFTPLLTYASALSTPETHWRDPRASALRARFADVTVRVATREQADHDLEAIFGLSLEAFAGNPFYTPIPREAFDALYRPLLARVPLDWVWLAEQDGQVVGYVFGIPDPTRPTGDTLIVKTVAIRSGRAYAGLGRHLVNELHERAFAAGFTRVVHALFWEGNDSAALSARLGRVIRRYALLAREP